MKTWPRVSRLADAQISEALIRTFETYGEHKYREYQDLIELALETLADQPRINRLRPEIRPEARVHHIKQPGRRARHLFLYYVADDGVANIVAFIYDGMDLPEQWPAG